MIYWKKQLQKKESMVNLLLQGPLNRTYSKNLRNKFKFTKLFPTTSLAKSIFGKPKSTSISQGELFLRCQISKTGWDSNIFFLIIVFTGNFEKWFCVLLLLINTNNNVLRKLFEAIKTNIICEKTVRVTLCFTLKLKVPLFIAISARDGT